MDAKGTKPIQSLARGLSLLELVGKVARPVSVREMTRELGIDRSSVFRLANTLRLQGFLAHAPGRKDYVLGSAIWRLANQLPWNQTLTQIAREHLAALAKETGETAHLVVREGRRALFVDHENTGQPLGVAGRSGHYEPLYCTAPGKALLSDLDGKQLVELLGNGSLETYSKYTITEIDALAEECARIRRCGYSEDNQEQYKGVRCVGSPIRDVSGSIVAAIGISAPVNRLPKRLFKERGRQVLHAANEIGVELGYDPK